MLMPPIRYGGIIAGFFVLVNFLTSFSAQIIPPCAFGGFLVGDTTKLHYSQTGGNEHNEREPFCTSTKLHYSQTGYQDQITAALFCTSTKLHYSQTI